MALRKHLRTKVIPDSKKEEVWDKNHNDKMRRFNFENKPLQDTVISNGCKDYNFQVKICDFFSLF